MTEKQERLLQLLGEFARICRENDLKYVTAEKTALGVMQRGGFPSGRRYGDCLYAGRGLA